MILTLEVISEQARKLGTASRKVFQGIGGTIGRLPDNDWVFADPYVSGRHALIRYVNGKYFIEDTSTNGVFINSRDNRLDRHQAHPLKDGDHIFIDAYHITVSIARDPARAAQPDPFASLIARASSSGAETRPAGARQEQERTASLADQFDAADDHDTEWFGMAEVTRRLPDAPAQGQGRVQPSRGEGAEPPGRRDEPAASRPMPPDRDGDVQLRQVLEAAGIDDTARATALLGAMRAAFASTLARFDPGLLQQEFDRHISKGSILGAPAKLRYWELYRDGYAQLLKNRESAFLDLFGEAFAAELERLRAAEERKGRQ